MLDPNTENSNVQSLDIFPFKRLIFERTGLNYKDNTNQFLPDAIRERMFRACISHPAQYYHSLRKNDDEIHHLINLITVNESYFLREPQHFRILNNFLFPGLLERKKDEEKKVRILSAGCSTGEEPYSILISLVKNFGEDVLDDVEVVAFDIDLEALATARLAGYGLHSFRGVDEITQRKFFNQIGPKRYQVKDKIKDKVHFYHLNLGSETLCTTLHQIDVIFYRNISIYFEEETQKKVFRNLASLLTQGGYLFTSSTETNPHDFGLLKLRDLNGVYFFAKGEDSLGVQPKKVEISKSPASTNRQLFGQGVARPNVASGKVASPPVPLSRPSSSLKLKKKSPDELYEEALGWVKKKNHIKAMTLIQELLKLDDSHKGGYALKAGILMNQSRIEDSRQCCEKVLEMDEWNLEAYLLLGILAKMEGDTREALKRFKSALYLDASNWLANFYLAEIYNGLGESGESRKKYQKALKLLEMGGLSNSGLTVFPLSFSVDQVSNLCQHSLEKLKNRIG